MRAGKFSNPAKDFSPELSQTKRRGKTGIDCARLCPSGAFSFRA